MALAVLGFVATDNFWVAAVAVGVAGAMMVVSGVGAQTLIQLTVEPAMLGRVMSLYGMIFRGGPAAGALIIGTLSEFFGLRLPLAGGAVFALAVWLVIWLKKRAPILALEEASE